MPGTVFGVFANTADAAITCPPLEVDIMRGSPRLNGANSSRFVALSPAGTANGSIISDTMLGSCTKVTVWISDNSAGLNQVTLSPALISTDCGVYV